MVEETNHGLKTLEVSSNEKVQSKQQEVRANAAMNAVLPRFVKQYCRAPYGRASSNPLD